MIIKRITNIITEDFYIGQTKKDIVKRFNKHKYNAKYGTDTYLYKAMRKYGVENFNIKLVESLGDETKLNDREKYYINELKPQYNMNEGGSSGNGMTSKHKEAMKKYHSTRSKESYASNGSKGKKMPYKSIQKIAQSNWKKCSCKGIEFDSILAACTHFEISYTTFTRWRKKGQAEIL